MNTPTKQAPSGDLPNDITPLSDQGEIDRNEIQRHGRRIADLEQEIADLRREAHGRIDNRKKQAAAAHARADEAYQRSQDETDARITHVKQVRDECMEILSRATKMLEKLEPLVADLLRSRAKSSG